jgi:hypothetical protein
VGLVLRLLSRQPPRGMHERHGQDLRQSRRDFERAWKVFLSNRTEADFKAWREQRDWTERKYALWDAGKKLEPPGYGPGKPCSRFRKCRCGEVFDMHRLEQNLMHVPHITAVECAAL